MIITVKIIYNSFIKMQHLKYLLDILHACRRKPADHTGMPSQILSLKKLRMSLLLLPTKSNTVSKMSCRIRL